MTRFQWMFGGAVGALTAVAIGCGGNVTEAPEELSTEDAVAKSESALRLRRLPNDLPFWNPSGFAATRSTAGSVDLTGPFFQSLGTNGRSCASCHLPTDGWSITPAHLRLRFETTRGLDPVFRTNDGSTSPDADVSTVAARREAYRMLLTKGLVRVSNPVPPGADYTLIDVDDPYHHASAADVSTFRRPLQTANIDALSTVMWDGRETQVTADTSSADLMGCTLPPTAPKCFKSLKTDLSQQANDATLGHAQATLGLQPHQIDEIVAFERSLSFGQIYDFDAKFLTARGGRGGPENIASQTFYFGQNDPLSGDYRTQAPFSTKVFDEYDAWQAASGRVADAHRASVARGQELFNSKPIAIVDVKGLNDDFALPVISGSCTTCHDTPHAGNHSIPAPLDIGLTGDHPEAMPRTPDLPLYTFRRNEDGATFVTTDPGRGLITGKFKDLGRFKGPTLRGVAARAPYFHNGSASDLEAVVEFYDRRFTIGLTTEEKADLAAFLKAL